MVGKSWTVEKLSYVVKKYGTMTHAEIGNEIGKSRHAVARQIARMRLNDLYQREYAIYKDDDYIFTGNIKDCSAFLGVKEKAFRFYMTPSNEKRKQGGIFVVDVGMWEKEELS